MQNKFTGNHACTSCIFITLIEPFLFTNSSLQPHQSSAQPAMTDCFCCSVAAETNYTTLIYRHLDCSVDKYSFSSFAFEIRIMSSCWMYSALNGWHMGLSYFTNEINCIHSFILSSSKSFLFPIHVLWWDSIHTAWAVQGHRATTQYKFNFPSNLPLLDQLKKNLMCQLPGHVLSHWSSAIWFKNCPPTKPDILNQQFFSTTWLWNAHTSLTFTDG